MKKDAFEIEGVVEAVLVATRYGDHVSAPVEKIQVVRAHGVRGDRHAGVRLADSRERKLAAHGIPKGTEIANLREFSATSVEELAAIAAAMDVPQVPIGVLGENLVVRGIPRFTELPPGTLLFFRSPSGETRTAVLAVWKENKPCIAPGEAIQALYPDRQRLAAKFPKAAMGLRGLLGVVYSSGFIHAGDEVVAGVPSQRIYSPQ